MKRSKNNNNKRFKHRINNFIKNVFEVRLVGDNIDNGIYSFKEAMDMANDLELDLVEISPNANPPVCKIIDYKKFIYDQEKNKNKVKKTVLKEIKLSPNTQDHDIDYRVKNAIKFLNAGNKVKVSMFFKGRQIQFKDAGELLILKFVEMLLDHGEAENLPKLNGKRMEVIIKPKKN